MMSRVFLPILFLSLSWAQEPTDLFRKAPPDVDEALRARIAKFYKAHVDGKPRLAEEVVAEDSKEIFYNAQKPRYLSYKINRIDYTGDFTQAKATVVCEMHMNALGFSGKPLPIPLPSTWKLVNGEWFWFVDPEMLKITPFGKMKEGDDSGETPAIQKGPDLVSLWSQVKADKSAVQLKAGEPSSDQVSITNKMPGAVSLSFQDPHLAWLKITLDRTELKAEEKATLTFRSDPEQLKKVPASPITVSLVVQPTNQIIPVHVVFSGAR